MAGFQTPEDLSEQRFGRLTAKRVVGRNKFKAVLWQCNCECGGEKIATSGRLKSGQTKSCGCLSRNITSERNKTHGLSMAEGKVRPEFRAWMNMIDRCYNSKHKSYRNYGGRGIKVCDSWRESFAAFWTDMGDRPSAKHSLDRKDNNGNYEPGNCRWATKSEQQTNRRTCRYFTHNGTTMCLKDWAIRLGVDYSGMRKKISASVSPESAFLAYFDRYVEAVVPC